MPNSLIRALAASFVLHLAIIAVAWWLPLLYNPAPRHTRHEFIHATLHADRPNGTTEAIAATAVHQSSADTVPARAETTNARGKAQRSEARIVGETSAPRFITPPGFEAIANYPLPLNFRLLVRLYVSASGHVQRVDVVSASGPIPTDLMDATLAELYNGRLTPAYRDGEADAASLDLTIGVDEAGITAAGSLSPITRPGQSAAER